LGGGTLNTVTNALVSDLNASGRAVALNLLGFSLSLGAMSTPLLMSIGDRLPSSLALRLLATGIAVILLLVLVLRFPPAKRPGTSVSKLLRALNQGPVWLFGVLLLLSLAARTACLYGRARLLPTFCGQAPTGRTWRWWH